MTKCKLIRVLAMTMALAMVMAVAGCSNGSSIVTEPKDFVETYTVKVANLAGTEIKKCSVEVFSDSGKTTQVYKGITNDEGEVTFSAPLSNDYVAVISKVPAGYVVETHYPLTGEKTNLVLRPGTLTEEAMETVRYSLGDPVMDFSVTTSDGEMVLSELLAEKKAVVLNFWFMNCSPCKMEFPYIQEGYEQLSDEIAVLAMNPVDSTDAEIAQFREDNGYTFAMAKCDFRWQEMLEIKGYPTTLIIDRYGNICLIHSGGIESTQEFLDMVTYFIQDDYEQQFFKSAGQIPAVTD